MFQRLYHLISSFYSTTSWGYWTGMICFSKYDSYELIKFSKLKLRQQQPFQTAYLKSSSPFCLIVQEGTIVQHKSHHILTFFINTVSLPMIIQSESLYFHLFLKARCANLLNIKCFHSEVLTFTGKPKSKELWSLSAVSVREHSWGQNQEPCLPQFID